MWRMYDVITRYCLGMQAPPINTHLSLPSNRNTRLGSFISTFVCRQRNENVNKQSQIGSSKQLKYNPIIVMSFCDVIISWGRVTFPVCKLLPWRPCLWNAKTLPCRHTTRKKEIKSNQRKITWRVYLSYEQWTPWNELSGSFSLPISREPRMTHVINQDGGAREIVWN